MEGGTRALTYTSENGSQEGWMENAIRLGALLVGLLVFPADGEGDDHCRSLAGSAVDLDRPAMSFSNPLADCQTEPGTRALPRAAPGGVCPPESIEYVREFTWRDPDSRITHREDDIVTSDGCIERDRSADRCVLDCIGQQIHQQLANPVAVD